MSFGDAMYEVLQNSRYDLLMGRRVDPGQFVQELIIRFFYWLFGHVDIVLPTGDFGGVRTVAQVFAIAGAVLVVVGIVVLVRTLLRARRPRVHDLSDIFEEIAHNNYTVSGLLNLSRTAENRRIAVRYAYIAALLSLNERDIIQIKPSATNALISRQIKESAPELSVPFGQIAEAFHYAWFGNKNIDDSMFQGYNSAVEGLVAYNA